jgi:hypothetical protein
MVTVKKDTQEVERERYWSSRELKEITGEWNKKQ